MEKQEQAEALNSLSPGPLNTGDIVFAVPHRPVPLQVEMIRLIFFKMILSHYSQVISH